jgi:hypothetical protein
MDPRHLGLDELMIVNPGPVGARPCRLTPLRPLGELSGSLGCTCQGSAAARLVVADDGTVYRAIGRATPMGRIAPVAKAPETR